MAAASLVDEGESEERLVNRFRREVMRAGEVKRRRYFENSQDERKRRATKKKGQDVSVPKKNDDDEDNWDLPPY